MSVTPGEVHEKSMKRAAKARPRGSAALHELVLTSDDPRTLEWIRAVLVASDKLARDPVAALADELLAEPVTPKLALAQARLRSRATREFLERFRVLSAREVDSLPGRSRSKSNPAAAASRWRRDGRIFSVRWKGVSRYPEFQFRDGEPVPEVRRILELLGPGHDGWPAAFWFASPHAYLGGDVPAKVLAEDPAKVAAAAEWQYAD